MNSLLHYSPAALPRPHNARSCHRCSSTGKVPNTQAGREKLWYCSGIAHSSRCKHQCPIHGEQVVVNCPRCCKRPCKFAFHPDCVIGDNPDFDKGKTTVRLEETKEEAGQKEVWQCLTVSVATGAGWLCPCCLKLCKCNKCAARWSAPLSSSSGSDASSAASSGSDESPLPPMELECAQAGTTERLRLLEDDHHQLAADHFRLQAEVVSLETENSRLRNERNAALEDVQLQQRQIVSLLRRLRQAQQLPLRRPRTPPGLIDYGGWVNGVFSDPQENADLYCAAAGGDRPESALAVAEEVRPCHRCGPGKDEGEQASATLPAVPSPIFHCAQCSLAYCRDCLGPNRQPRPADCAAAFTWLRLTSCDALWICPKCQGCCACDACAASAQRGETEGETVDAAVDALSGLSLQEKEPAETSAGSEEGAVNNEGQTLS